MVKIGFIGTGGISGAHMKVLQKRDDVKIAALCDINREQALKRQKEFGGDIFTDFNEMLDKTNLDAVLICTPPSVRRAPLLACADRGIPVFCEKPVERSVAAGRQIAVELKKRKAKVQIGYVFRSTPVAQVARELAHHDKIHLVHSFYACPVSLNMGLPKWFYDKSKSGGALIDQATHNLDFLRYLFGEVCAHTHTWVGDAWRNEITFSGEKNFYRLNLNKGLLTGDKPVVENLNFSGGKQNKPSKETNSFRFQPDERSIFEYEHEVFLNQVVTGKWQNNPSDYADGLKTLELTHACNRAIAGVTVKI